MIESNETLFTKIMEWVWIPAFGLIGWMWMHFNQASKDIFGIVASLDKTTDKRLSMLEHHYVDIVNQLNESEKRRREDRQEIIAKIERHHEVIYKKLDLLTDRVPRQ